VVKLQSGQYQKIVPSLRCISNAMNVGHPSNFARVVALFGGWMDETGNIREMPDMVRLKKEMPSTGESSICPSGDGCSCNFRLQSHSS
jgi:threonine synthase